MRFLGVLAFMIASPTAAQTPDSKGHSADTVPGDNIPPFALLTPPQWGALPTGTVHTLPPRTIDLHHQDIRVQFDWSRHAVVGSTTLRIAALVPTSSVSIDAVGMTFRSVRVRKRVVKPAYDGQTLTIPMPARLGRGDTISVSVEYETIAPKLGAHFIDRAHIMWTQSWAVSTRFWLPTIDRPDDKATWDMTIIVPANEKALFNGELIDTTFVDGGQRAWHWRQALPASTYHLVAVTGNYAVIHDAWDGIPVNYWVYPDSIEQAKHGFQVTPDVMRVYSEVTGVRYPWAKYDQVVAPDFTYGGMESVTATVQDDRSIFSSPNAQRLVAHELAHQWFGNYVTPADWNDAWLSEGFATYMPLVYFERTRQTEAFVLERLQQQFGAIQGDIASRRPLSFARYDTVPEELYVTRAANGALSNGIIYARGASVITMLRFTVGDSVFWKGIHSYLTRHALGLARSDDLRRAMERASGRDLGEFFRQWVYGAGIPVLRIAQRYNATSRQLTVTVHQVQSRDSFTGLFTMDVPISVETDSGVVRTIAAIRGETTVVTMTLPASPRMIRWDPESIWLSIIDFPRSTNMLLYQFTHGDLLARWDALLQLEPRLAEPGVREAFESVAASDSSNIIRDRTSASLGRQ